MTTTGSRIKEIRKEYKLTQEQFGQKIGIKDSAVSMLEKDERRLTESVIKNIVFQFCINDVWLRDGTGEKYDRNLLNKRALLSKPLDGDQLDIFIKIQALGTCELKHVLRFLDYMQSERGLESFFLTEDEEDLLSLYRGLDARGKEETISFVNFKICTGEIQKKKD